jgi:biotin synthase
MIWDNSIEKIAEKVLAGKLIGEDDALKIAELGDNDTFDLLCFSDKIRKKLKGNKVNLCSIVNAKSGRCGEDCSFCAQSAHFKTDIKEYPLLKEEEILEKAGYSEKLGAHEFSIVTSGKELTDGDLQNITRTVSRIKEKSRILRCASIGMLDGKTAHHLKEAGLQKYHHNLETARSFFPKICSTHSYDENIETIRNAKREGLFVCSGGIFGMGESWEQRIEMALTLRGLDVDSVPINFLNPIKGTELEGRPLLNPLEALRIIALFRFILPKKEIIVCGGREVTLRDLQPMVFAAGATGILIGNYLTTEGREPEQDLQMIKDWGRTL